MTTKRPQEFDDVRKAARFIQKVRQNRYYASLWEQTKDQRALLYAGFFDDGLDRPAFEYPWANTVLPLANYRTIAKRYAACGGLDSKLPYSKRVVLVSTGAYSPSHAGHLSMMEQARTHCERMGWVVLGGFLSPSHDLYVNQKANGAARRQACVRIEGLRRLLAQSAGSDWLSVHPWESLCAPCPLNFTDVLDRIDQELRTYLSVIPSAPVELVYVFGSDNQGFMHAFTNPALEHRIGLCVGRLEPEKFTVSNLPEPALEYDWNVCGNLEAVGLSSSRVRAQFNWQRCENPHVLECAKLSTKGPPLYIVRSDLIESLPPALQGRVPRPALDSFLNGLIKALGSALPEGLCVQTVPVLPDSWAQPLDPSTTLVLDKPLSRLIQESKTPWPGAQVAQVSRVFELSSTQDAPIGMVSNLSEVLSGPQARLLTHVLDDDRGSGRTTAWVAQEFARHGLEKPVFHYTLDAVLQGQSEQVFDVVDARDFLLGFWAAGLVVQIEGSSEPVVRVPYWSPFVNLVARAKLLPAHQKDFTTQVLHLNFEFFTACANAGVDVLICDLDFQAQAFLKYCGFTRADSALKVIESSLKQLC